MDIDKDIEKYMDIIDLPRPRSLSHPPMSASNRAAQFAPFAALTGFGEAIKNTTASHMEEETGENHE